MIRTIGVAIVWPLVIVHLAWWALDHLPIQSPVVHVITGAGLLMAASFACIARRDPDLDRSAWQETVTRLATTTAGFVALSVWAGIPIEKVVGAIGIATLCAAFAEEIVFRRWIPGRIRRDDARPRAALLILPQISFSLAHAANPSFVAARPNEFLSLFLAGLLYTGLARIGGLGMAAAVHGALNLALT